MTIGWISYQSFCVVSFAKHTRSYAIIFVFLSKLWGKIYQGKTREPAMFKENQERAGMLHELPDP